MSQRAPYRAIQWATGAMGRSCLRAIIDRDDTELAGLFVYNPAKVGVDAGKIVYRDSTGVTGTSDREEILALDADVVIHCSRIQKDQEVHDNDILALLRSGKNVISINGNSFPPAWRPARREAFEQACAEGNATFLGAGLNPGFIAEKFLGTVSGICTRINRVFLHETVLAGMIRSPEYVFDMLGFGSDPGAINLEDGSFAASVTLNIMYEEVVNAIADQHGWQLDEIRRAHRMLPAKNDLEIGAGTILKGQVSHVDWRWMGMSGGEPRIELKVSWAVDPEYTGSDPDLWRVEISGEPNVSVKFNVERPEEMPGSTTGEQMAVSGAVANAIPYVVAAPAGLLTANFATPYFAHPLDEAYLRKIPQTFR